MFWLIYLIKCCMVKLLDNSTPLDLVTQICSLHHVTQESDIKEGTWSHTLQDGCPVAFASKALTPTEQWYANIECEMLACIFGAEWYTYVFGHAFAIESDHEPPGADQPEKPCWYSSTSTDAAQAAKLWCHHQVSSRKGDAYCWCAI